MRRLLYLAMLSLVATLVFAPAALAYPGVTCTDFNTQAEVEFLYGDQLDCPELPAELPPEELAEPSTEAQGVAVMPNTGGPSLLLPASLLLLLLSSGLFGLGAAVYLKRS